MAPAAAAAGRSPSIIASATLAGRDAEIALPFWLAGAGVVASIIGTFAVSTKEKGRWRCGKWSPSPRVEETMATSGFERHWWPRRPRNSHEGPPLDDHTQQ